MKLIFLDIDGVFNSYNFIEYSRLHRLQEFCPASVQNVREICKRTGAKIVVSSTWRRRRSLTALRKLFNCYDLGKYVVGKTPVLDGQIRGKEIQAYLNANIVDAFVIIDDDADMDDLMPHLAQCKNYSGFAEGWKREMAIAILNKQPYVRLSELPVGSMFDYDGKVISREELDRIHELHHLYKPVKLISNDYIQAALLDAYHNPDSDVYSGPNSGPVVLIDVERKS